MSDTLRLKGFLTNPSEIEEFLLTHPNITAVQVVGTIDQDTVEDIAVAFVQSLSGLLLNEQELLDYCRASIANFKVPTRIIQLAEYPTTPSANGDKVQKERLRKMAEEHVLGHMVITQGE
jgi:fatty-acyl-CoA synthase